MDCLSKEQLLLLLQNLTYEKYEQFINMFPKDKNNCNIINNFHKLKKTNKCKSLIEYIYILIQSILTLLLILLLSLLICFFKDNVKINVKEFISYVNSTIKYN